MSESAKERARERASTRARERESERESERASAHACARERKRKRKSEEERSVPGSGRPCRERNRPCARTLADSRRCAFPKTAWFQVHLRQGHPPLVLQLQALQIQALAAGGRALGGGRGRCGGDSSGDCGAGCVLRWLSRPRYRGAGLSRCARRACEGRFEIQRRANDGCDEAREDATSLAPGCAKGFPGVSPYTLLQVVFASHVPTDSRVSCE